MTKANHSKCDTSNRPLRVRRGLWRMASSSVLDKLRQIPASLNPSSLQSRAAPSAASHPLLVSTTKVPHAPIPQTSATCVNNLILVGLRSARGRCSVSYPFARDKISSMLMYTTSVIVLRVPNRGRLELSQLPCSALQHLHLPG